MNNFLPLIDVYPIVENQPSQMEITLSQHQGIPLQPRKKVNNSFELAIEMANCCADNSLPRVLHSALSKSEAYKKSKKAMPNLSHVKNISTYRKKYPHYDKNGVNQEIHQYGKLLTPNQVIFHGGEWGNGCPCVGQSITLNNPFSTSICPQVAAIHANYHNGKGFLWVITIENQIRTPVFVFNDHSRQKLSHEREILFASGAVVTCNRILPTSKITILEVSLR